MIGGIDKYFYNIIVERSTPTTDAWGNTIQAWVSHLTIKGLLRQLNGEQSNVGQRDVVLTSHRLYCRLADITTNDRIVYGGFYYDVVRVNNVMGFDQLLQVDCNVYG